MLGPWLAGRELQGEGAPLKPGEPRLGWQCPWGHLRIPAVAGRASPACPCPLAGPAPGLGRTPPCRSGCRRLLEPPAPVLQCGAMPASPTSLASPAAARISASSGTATRPEPAGAARGSAWAAMGSPAKVSPAPPTPPQGAGGARGWGGQGHLCRAIGGTRAQGQAELFCSFPPSCKRPFSGLCVRASTLRKPPCHGHRAVPPPPALPWPGWWQ